MKKRILSVLLVSLMIGGCNVEFNKIIPFYYPEASKEADDKLTINPYLWQATLAKLGFMPLLSTDAKGGVVVTDWTPMGNENETFKITATVTSQQLRADGIEVKVQKRELVKGKWVEAEADKRLAIDIEKVILAEARKLFRRDVMGRDI